MKLLPTFKFETLGNAHGLSHLSMIMSSSLFLSNLEYLLQIERVSP